MTDRRADAEHLRRQLQRLTGRTAKEAVATDALTEGWKLLTSSETGLGWSQLNELLLLLGLPRVSRGFFQFLIDGSTAYEPGNAVGSSDDLDAGITAFQVLALLLFGNVRHGFELLRDDEELLIEHLELVRQAELETFETRHAPVYPIDRIDGPDTYLLGYLSATEIEQRLTVDPDDPWAVDAKTRRPEVIARGKRNQEAYLASDHLDIYVATSMRKRHEFIQVHRWTREIFASDELAPLKLRYFDPTQAYCDDRIDKGLAEALMLKRAKGTLYFAQESDTFGKDSELASTLAQGKSVVIYVPVGDRDFVDRLLADMKSFDPGRPEAELILEQLQVFDSGLAWREEGRTVREALERRGPVDVAVLRARLDRTVREHYDKRARTLRDLHPLGIQVHLESGVANGVLVARTLSECARLLRGIVLNELDYVVDDPRGDGRELYLRVPRAVDAKHRDPDDRGSIFRVQTGDPLLTHTFWSFYTRSRRPPS